MPIQEKMVIPKKQMALALIVLTGFIILSGFWIVQSLKANIESALPASDSDKLNSNAVPVSGKETHFVKILLIEKDCRECASLQPLIDSIKSLDVNVLQVRKVNADSEEGKKIIEMHAIKALPSLIVNGEFQGTKLQELWQEIGEEKNGVLILRESIPPYYSVEEERVIGKVNLFIIKNSFCSECIDLNFFSQDLRDLNVLIESEETLEFTSSEGQKLIKEYSIKRLPAAVLKGDAIEYPFLAFVWEQLGTIELDGTLVYRSAVPYFDLNSGKTKGLVQITRLIDANCFDCVDVNKLVSPLKEMGLKIIQERTVDFSSLEGKELIEKYSIKKIPTIIVSSEANEYNTFSLVWSSVGTQEEDNNFVFRNVEVLNEKFITLN
jgi:hypothetical protein